MNFWTIAGFAGGLILLVAGAESLIRGAARLARMASISPLVVGLTVVAFGTGAPELAVSIGAGLSGQPEIALGNVVGSNIFNTLFILGVCALILPLAVSRQLIRLDVPILIGATALVFLLGLDGTIGRIDGLILAATIAVYTLWLIVQSRREGKNDNDDFEKEFGPVPTHTPRAIAANIFLVIIGFALLVVGSRLLVQSSVAFARYLGISEFMIGLTIVAMGTSLPEVATSIVAGIRGERDIAVGNVIGSNIFNLLAVLGVAAAVTPGGMPLPPQMLVIDFPILLAIAVICLPIFVTGTRISRWEGALLLTYYIVYILWQIGKARQWQHIQMMEITILHLMIPATALILIMSFFGPEQMLARIAPGLTGELEHAALASLRQVRRIVIGLIGGTVIIIGTALLVLPGPAFIVIPLGLAILGTEYAWARRLLYRLRDKMKDTAGRVGIGKRP